MYIILLMIFYSEAIFMEHPIFRKSSITNKVIALNNVKLAKIY